MFASLLHTIRPAVILLLIFTLLLGGGYTAVVTGIASLAFPQKAEGSLWTDSHGTRLGSALIGQDFHDPKHLWGRPSATMPSYNASASGASNYAAGNPQLLSRIKQRLFELRAADPSNMQTVPVDLVTASASGLDPDISAAAADYQLGRIARARGMPEAALRDIFHGCAKDRLFGLIGEPVIDVLCVNLTLDGKLPRVR